MSLILLYNMNNKYRLLMSVMVFVLLVSSLYVLAQEAEQESEEPVIKVLTSEIESVVDEETGLTTYTYSGSNSSVKIGDNEYKNILPAEDDTIAYIKVNVDGEIIKADITASNDTSFVFNDKKIDVVKGTRIFYEGGKINIRGEVGDEVGFRDKIEMEGSDYEFEDAQKIKLKEFTLGGGKWGLVSTKKPQIIIEGNKIKGSSFEIGDLSVMGQSNENLGEITLVPEGYLLGKKSRGDWRGLSLTTEDNLLLANSEKGIENYNNWILPESEKLIASGENFQINFNKNNGWTKVDSNDNFAIRAGKDFKMELENRDVVTDGELGGLIPKMSVSGDFAMNQNYKSLYTKGEKIMINRRGNVFYSRYGRVESESSTSPMELLIKNSEGNLNQEKYIVSNFRGIATVPLDASEEISDERYANSIYQIRAKTDNRYNYPTIDDFESISGKKLEISEGKINKPEYVRTLLDLHESNPNSFQGTKKIIIENGGPFSSGGVYYENTETFHIYDRYSIGKEFPIIIHEAGHGIHLGKSSSVNRNPTIDSEWNKLLKTKYEDINYVDRGLFGGLVEKWNLPSEELSKRNDFFSSKNLIDSSRESPYDGFLRAYGATNIKEDIATYREIVVGDPAYFKRYGLLDDLEGNILYDPVYKQKLDLMYDYAFITDKEYDAVFHPEKYGLE